MFVCFGFKSGVINLIYLKQLVLLYPLWRLEAGNTEGGTITVLLTSCFTGLDWSVLQMKTKIATGGQRYNETSPFSVPCLRPRMQTSDKHSDLFWCIDKQRKFYNIATKTPTPDRKAPILVISLVKTDLTVYCEEDLDVGASKKSLQSNRQVLRVRSSPWSAELVSTSKIFFFFTNAAAILFVFAQGQFLRLV